MSYSRYANARPCHEISNINVWSHAWTASAQFFVDAGDIWITVCMMNPATKIEISADDVSLEGEELIVFGGAAGEKCKPDENHQPNSGGSFRRIPATMDLVEEGRKAGRKLDELLK
jgi:hypothetical protein